MQKSVNKLGRRIAAVVLSVLMLMSSVTVYADEEFGLGTNSENAYAAETEHSEDIQTVVELAETTDADQDHVPEPEESSEKDKLESEETIEGDSLESEEVLEEASLEPEEIQEEASLEPEEIQEEAVSETEKIVEDSTSRPEETTKQNLSESGADTENDTSEAEKDPEEIMTELDETDEVSSVSEKLTEDLTEDAEIIPEENKDEEGLVISFTDKNTYEYTGGAIKPEIKVTNNGQALTEGIDYTIGYSNNVKVSTGAAANRQPRITVTGKGKFTGNASANFRITRKDIQAEDVIKSRIIAVQGKKVPKPELYYGSVKLTVGDFFYDKNTVFSAAGNETLTVRGTGNFRGNATIDVVVVANAAARKDIARKFTVTVDQERAKELIYTGENLEEAIKNCIRVNAADSAKTDLTANAEENYILIFPKDVTNAGTVKFTVAGTGDYSGCNITKSCKILQRTVKAADIVVNDTEENEVTEGKITISGAGTSTMYTNTGATFAGLRLRDGSKEMREGQDYKITYDGNKKAANGKARYTISFLNNYRGKYTSPYFDIAKAELSKATVDRVLLPDQVCSGKDGVYKSGAHVSVGGVTLKASEYEVRYYTDAERTQEMSKSNPVRLQNGAAAVYVKILPKASGNYMLPTNQEAAEGVYTVWAKGNHAINLSKAKVSFYDNEDRKITKLGYTGRPVKPAKIEVSIGGRRFLSDDTDAPFTCEIVNNTNKGKATVVIKAKTGSGYMGSKTATFRIISKDIKGLLFREKPKDPADPDEPADQDKILVVYFSWSNNTRRMAEFIQSQTGGDLYEIVPVTPYPTEYTPTTEVAKEERDHDARPEIQNLPASIAEYDRILIGYPIWWHTAPMIIGTFLEAYDLEGVNIYPFTQSASMDTGQFNQSMQFVRRCAPGAVVHDGLFTRATNTDAIIAYLEKNGLKE